MTRVSTLLASTPFTLGSNESAAAELDVTSLTADSRKVVPGSMFFAIPGNKAHGSTFIADAIHRGAVAIVSEQPDLPLQAGVSHIIVDDVRRSLALAAAAQSVQPETVVAVTGTSGKTSVAAFCRQIWSKLGESAASVGTLGIVGPSGNSYGSLTTPDPLTLHRDLDQLAKDGVTHLALEASSHGIEQRRLDGVRLKAAAFTNLSRDHLDYHGTLELYLQAKLRLFTTLLPPGAPAVVNADSDVADQVVAACKAHGREALTVGREGTFLKLVHLHSTGLGMSLAISTAGSQFDIALPLAGDFQVANALVAAGLCIATGSATHDVIAALAELQGAPGRLQLVGQQGTAPVFVDYAHKPDALENVLHTLRPLAQGKLVVVFGCGGDRDQGKRPIMGEIASRLADRVIVTDDNPRSEPPASIRKEILAGARAGARVEEIADRATAIRQSIADLRDGDVLVIAGKGHETGQIVGDKVHAFSDIDCAAQALQSHLWGGRNQ